MCVYVCISVYMCVSVCMYVYVCVCVYITMYICICVYLCVFAYICMHMCIFVYDVHICAKHGGNTCNTCKQHVALVHAMISCPHTQLQQTRATSKVPNHNNKSICYFKFVYKTDMNQSFLHNPLQAPHEPQ